MSATRLPVVTLADSIKFEGCYLVIPIVCWLKPALAPDLGVPSSPGVPAAAQHTITLPFNDLDAVAECLAEKGEEVPVLLLILSAI